MLFSMDGRQWFHAGWSDGQDDDYVLIRDEPPIEAENELDALLAFHRAYIVRYMDMPSGAPDFDERMRRQSERDLETLDALSISEHKVEWIAKYLGWPDPR
jgi:hypothetical protein